MHAGGRTQTPYAFGETMAPRNLSTTTATIRTAGCRKESTAKRLYPLAVSVLLMRSDFLICTAMRGEWCQDVWHKNYRGAPTDGSALAGRRRRNLSGIAGRLICDNGYECRSAYRASYLTHTRNIYPGFRVVVSALKSPQKADR